MTSTKELIVFLLTLQLCCLVHTTPISPTVVSDNGTENNDMMHLFAQDEPQSDQEASAYTNKVIEDIKARILKNLQKKEAPKRHAPPPPLQALNFRNDSGVSDELVADVSESNSKLVYADARKRRQSEFVYAVVENGDNSSNPSVRFHFDLPQHVVAKDFESVELWLFKKEAVRKFTISRVIVSEDNNEDKLLPATVRNQTHAKGWIRFNMSQMLSTENVTSLDLQIFKEGDEWSLEFEENKIPFLVVRTEERAISKRSTIDCDVDNSTCCRDNFYVNFIDAGWGEWIVHPKGFDAKLCKGGCMNHVGLPLKHHGRIMMQLCNRNPSLARELGKSECVSCAPISYHSMSFIYLDEEGVQVITEMKDMAISQCGCI